MIWRWISLYSWITLVSMRSHWSFWIDCLIQEMMCDYFHFALSIVCTDGLTIFGARTSRGILMTIWVLFLCLWYFEGKANVPFETPCLCNIGHIANNCLTSIHIVCIYEYVDDYLPATDWWRRCWGWPRGIVHGSIYQNITELWMYLNFHYVTLSTYQNLPVSSWIEKMNFVRIVGCMSFTFGGIAGCMTLNFNASIYNSLNFLEG